MSRLCLAFACAAFFCLPPTLAADKPKPQIKSVSVLALKAGQTATVSVFGDDLAPKDISVGKPGLTAKLLGVKPTEDKDKERGKITVSLELAAAPGCKPDIYPVTLVHEGDVKAVANVVVVEPAAAEADVKRPCGTFAQAMPLVGSSVAIAGNVQNDTPDVFKFEAKAGQTWTISLLAGRGGSQLDPILRLRDVRHFSLALSAGDDKRDRQITFKVPADGTYFLELADGEGRGGPGFLYRLTLRQN